MIDDTCFTITNGGIGYKIGQEIQILDGTGTITTNVNVFMSSLPRGILNYSITKVGVTTNGAGYTGSTAFSTCITIYQHNEPAFNSA